MILKFDHRIRDLKYDEINEVFYILFENIPAVGVLKFIKWGFLLQD